jgi:hypothetical protein
MFFQSLRGWKIASPRESITLQHLFLLTFGLVAELLMAGR